MKILFVMDSLGTGGAERSTADLWYYLRSQQIALEIIVLEHRKEGVEKEILDNGFSVHFIKGRTFFAHSLEIARMVRKFRPQIVHSVLVKSNLRTRIARLFTTFKHVESLVNCTYDRVRFNDPRVNRPLLWSIKLIDQITHRLTDHFVAITKVVKLHYQEMVNIPDSKISVVYRGRNANQFIGDRENLKKHYCETLSMPENAIIVIHVGRQEYQKGHITLLKALEGGSLEINAPISFLFLGRAGNSTPDIKNLISKNKIPYQLLWLGHRHDVEQLLAVADIFVFPSLYEGLGGALIEAQAAGLPIICSEIPVLNEVVIKGENALMFNRGDSSLLSNILFELVNDRQRRFLMSGKSLDNFYNRFKLENINRDMLKVYNIMLSESQRPAQ